MIVEVPDRGLQLVDEAVGANTASEQQILSRLEPEEIAMLESLLRKVLATVEPPEVA